MEKTFEEFCNETMKRKGFKCDSECRACELQWYKIELYSANGKIKELEAQIKQAIEVLDDSRLRWSPTVVNALEILRGEKK